VSPTPLYPAAGASRRARQLAGCFAALLIAGACSSSHDATRTTGTAPGTTEEAPLGFAPASLHWADCGGRLQCASLEVPLDYDDPSGSMITLAVAMLPATDPDARIGVLVTNPGGPGGSGIDFLGNDGPFNDDINRRFDIVSWDPRGVGRTEPLACGEQLAQWFLTVDLAPVDPAGRDALERRAQDVTACSEANGALLHHVGTAEAVQDVEAIRLALGDDPVTYVGFSYGTLIGLRYAERFPGSLRAMAIDGIVDPEQTLGDQLTTTAASIDRSLAAALAACDDGCPIKDDPLAAYRQVVELARHEPLHTDDGQEVASNAVVLAGIAVTYDDGLRDLFYAAIAEGQRGLGNLFEQFAEGFVGEFDLAPTIAVNCGDLPHPISTEQVEELAAGAARDATVVPGLASGYVRAFALPCLDWPVQAPGTLQPVTAAGSPPILVIGNTGDPVTPYDAARRVAGSLERGRLLTYHGAGHTTYGEDHCADTYIDSYLVDLVLPPSGADCPG
jgi:pimeloyl-ACP methyl ester carboxylesterase